MHSLWFPVYRLLGPAVAPLARRRLARAAAGDPALAARQVERGGHVPSARGELWIHAASVGELNAAEPLILELTRRHPVRIVVSTLTHTAAARAGDRLTGDAGIRHVFAPLDTTATVRRWLDHTRPARLLLVETEIWPVLLHACRRRGIPVAMINARVSARAMGRYRRFAGLFRDALRDIQPVLCQSEADARRLGELGVPPDRLAVTGNLKFDLAPSNAPSERVLAWARAWQGRHAWVAGSTHAGEEALVAAAHRRLLASNPDSLAVVVPRHPERAAEVLGTLSGEGLDACLVDELAERPTAQCVVVDRMGVLVDLYRLADAVFVGGSLVPGIGGHNLMEAALTGTPVAAGPHLEDQRDAERVLADVGALASVDSSGRLADVLAGWLGDPAGAARTGARGREAAESQRGAVAVTLDRLGPWLAPVVGASPH